MTERVVPEPKYTANRLQVMHGGPSALRQANFNIKYAEENYPDDEEYLGHWRAVAGILSARRDPMNPDQFYGAQ